jgi:hypothetical protein
MENNLSVLAKAIGSSVGYYPAEVIKMLKRSGYTVTEKNSSSKDLIDLVLYALQNSITFRNEFDVFVKNNENVLLKDYLGIDSAWITGGAGVLTGVIGLIGGKQQQDAIKGQANSQAKLAEAQLQIAQLNQQTELAKLEALKQGAGTPTKSNTALYVGLGVGGVVILGLVVFLAVKK